MELSGQIAIITGGGRGIGRAIARKFAADGAAILVTARSHNEVQQVAAEIQKAGGRASAVVADVSNAADCERVVRAAHDAFGMVHILVNNAGMLGPVQSVEKLQPREWDEVMAVNLRGPFLLSRLMLPEMYQRRSGSILNIVSIAAKAAFPLNAAYAASKAGLMGLTRTLAAEAARKGVRVNALSPGPVSETGMLEDLGQGLSEYLQTDKDKISARMFEGILQGRPQTMDEIASAALFLVSDQASAITGQTLNVDGGMAFY
ncbi:MAG TPA: SDR family NAD(P)-dependent oxidoreductase [Candidatus Acidoferrales bacterium]|nr:SDR family NAD(P)-dependent oxidoreductase [Candidatus Acidoferrales bacterium]